jgi:acetyl-CoA C-acetyltransferase
MREAVVVDGVRTAIGKMGGSLARYRPEELGAFAIKALVEKTKVNPEIIDDVFMGISNTWNAAYHPARWATLRSGLPYRVPAVTVERACASSLQAMVFGALHIWANVGDVFIAGGMESWSQCPWMLGRADEAYAFTPPQILKRETAAPPDEVPMGLTAESLAEMYGVTREEQDGFGFRSQERALKAIESGIFKEEIFPVAVPQKKGPPVVFEVDEFPRRTTLEKMRSLSPAFKKDGTVTAATACGRNDAGSACLVMARERAEQLGYKPLAKLVAFAAVGVDPKLMGIGPAFAIPKLLKQTGMKIEQMDVIEINEAFAAQVLADIKELDRQGIHIDPEAINPNGGAIALGHPNGATGVRLAMTLVRELHRRKGRYGLVSLCIGGGQGLATLFERIE